MAMCEFAKPWYRSDVILRAEDRKFHVHKNTLGLWSPVFDSLIKARKTANEIIELPKKKAKEIYELLLVIYNLQTVNSQNIISFLKLAKEFEIEKVLYLCSSFLLEIEKPDLKCINFLLLAERYGLEDVKQQCFEIAASFSLSHLKTSEKFEELSMESKFHITEIMLMQEQAFVEDLKKKSFKLLQTVYLTGHEKFVTDMQPTVRRPFVYSCRKRPAHSALKENGRVLPRVYDLECSVCRATTENWARRKEQHYPMNKELYDATLMKEMFTLCHGQKDNKMTS
ncbi:BTB and MATH domain-containing 36-like [Paramuricea clavata]|uniref:BTB and MATH domain-containing 36-like n=2 Tax=Paramuricea clavata TaxID=317549 RepID=A0A6S7KSZ7_PARCT|nr:BTB and MATH domain-containing 36-like [Paramuricea clavata]